MQLVDKIILLTNKQLSDKEICQVLNIDYFDLSNAIDYINERGA